MRIFTLYNQVALDLLANDLPIGATFGATAAASDVLEGSNDNSNWTTVQTFAAGATGVTVTPEYRYLRSSASDTVLLYYN